MRQVEQQRIPQLLFPASEPWNPCVLLTGSSHWTGHTVSTRVQWPVSTVHLYFTTLPRPARPARAARAPEQGKPLRHPLCVPLFQPNPPTLTTLTTFGHLGHLGHLSFLSSTLSEGPFCHCHCHCHCSSLFIVVTAVSVVVVVAVICLQSVLSQLCQTQSKVNTIPNTPLFGPTAKTTRPHASNDTARLSLTSSNVASRPDIRPPAALYWQSPFLCELHSENERDYITTPIHTTTLYKPRRVPVCLSSFSTLDFFSLYPIRLSPLVGRPPTTDHRPPTKRPTRIVSSLHPFPTNKLQFSSAGTADLHISVVARLDVLLVVLTT